MKIRSTICSLKFMFVSSTKLRVADLAEKSNNSAAGCKFGASKKLIQDWWKHLDKIKDLPKTKCVDCLGNFLH